MMIVGLALGMAALWMDGWSVKRALVTTSVEQSEGVRWFGMRPRSSELPVMAQPNAGQPKLVDMKVVYDETPAEMVKGVVPLLETGANIVGAGIRARPAGSLVVEPIRRQHHRKPYAGRLGRRTAGGDHLP